VNIFDETPDFLNAIKVLNDEDEKQCACDFSELALKMSEDGLNISANEGDVYGAILDRVAFFPLKPVVMQEELVRLGMRESLSRIFAAVWAENAKKVVLARRKVLSDLSGVEYEVVRNIATEEENVNLHLNYQDGLNTVINFNVEELFAFYKQLEIFRPTLT